MNHKAIATQFKNELAAQYDLPELRSAEMTATDTDKGTYVLVSTEDVEVLPTGQFFAVFNTLMVQVWASFDKTTGFVYGGLSYKFTYHDGGSNGARREFILIVERNFGDEQYKGYIDRRLMYAHTVNMERYEAKRKKELEQVTKA